VEAEYQIEVRALTGFQVDAAAMFGVFGNVAQ
jgi:hypothetical protein